MVLGSRIFFSLPVRTNEDRRCIRRFVCLDSARLSRIYGMLASSAFREERSAIFAHDRQVVCDLAEAPGRFWTSLDRRAALQEVRGSEKICDGRYQHSGLLAEPTGRDE